MAEYIERDALRQAVLESQHDNSHPRGWAHIAHDCEHAHFVAMIARFPAADVAPVVHGCWELIRGGEFTSAFKCSVCGRRVCVSCDSEKTHFYLKDRYPYCNCGAKMDGGAV